MAPDKIQLPDGSWVDYKTAPAWWEHWVPGGLRHKKTLKTAADNAKRNEFGNDVCNAILWIIAGLIVITVVALVVKISG